MARHALDPLHLDVAALARDGEGLDGQWPMSKLPRLEQSQTQPNDAAVEPVHWSVRGESRRVAGKDAQTWLHLRADTSIWLTCQRCLAPMRLPLAIDTAIRFVRGEAEAEALDAESEVDVLALAPAIDLRQLVEDELLLALPLVPRHESCPEPLPTPAATGNEGVAPTSPFAALQVLKSGPPG